MTREAEALKAYREIVNEEFIRSVSSADELVPRIGVFTAIVTVWLMIFQRLHGDKTLKAAVCEVRTGSSRQLLEQESIRVRRGRISGSTGGYSRARSRLALSLVEQIADKIASALVSTHRLTEVQERRVLVVDGSTVRITYTDENRKKYPQYRNQHGEAHFPLVRVGVATDALTGIAFRPAYGAYNGQESVDELSLAEELFGRIPIGSIVIGDRFYGNPRFAASAAAAGHDCICRVKESNSKRYLGTPTTKSGERDLEWKSGRSRTGKTYSVSGRLVWHTIERKGYRPLRLVLFTTLTLPVIEIVELYRLRWNVELDLRDIKSVLDMDMLYAKSPDMLEKELILGITAYNLVRHLMQAAAIQLKVAPRRISFSSTLRLVRAIHSQVAVEAQVDLEQALHYLFSDAKSLMLPKPRSRPTEPRKVWPRGQVHFFTTSREEERKKLARANRLTSK